MLEVHTQAVEADFTGFPLTVSIEPDCSCDPADDMACWNCGTKTVIFNAAERDDGVMAQRLTLRGRTDDIGRVLREALDMLEVS